MLISISKNRPQRPKIYIALLSLVFMLSMAGVYGLSNGFYNINLKNIFTLTGDISDQDVQSISYPLSYSKNEESNEDTEVETSKEETDNHPDLSSTENINVNVVLPTPALFQATYYNGNKIVYGKILDGYIPENEFSKYIVKIYYTNSNDTSKHSEKKFDFIGEASLELNNDGDISFLLNTPGSEGGYLTAELVYSYNGLEAVSDLANPIENSTFTVDSTADTADHTLNGICSVGTATGGACTLRAAIAEANNVAGSDNIHFNIPTSDDGYINPDGSRTSTMEPGGTYTAKNNGYFIIEVEDPSLSISDPAGLLIDGYTQPGAVKNTASFGDTINAELMIQTLGDTVSGFYNPAEGSSLEISGINATVIGATDTVFSNKSNVTLNLHGNFFGTTIDGLDSLGVATIRIYGEGSETYIGTNGDGINDKEERNLISGNWSGPYNIVTNDTLFTDISVVAGNYIGTDKTGEACIELSTGTGRRGRLIVGGTNARVGSNLDGISDNEESNIIGCTFPGASPRADLLVTGGGTSNSIVINKNFVGITPQGNNIGHASQGGIRTFGVVVDLTITENMVVNYGTFGLLLHPLNLNMEDNVIKNIGTDAIWVGANQSGTYGGIISNNLFEDITSNVLFNEAEQSNFRVFSNTMSNVGDIGIDLSGGNEDGEGVNYNDLDDSDDGPNNLMNHPVINSISYNGGGVYSVGGVVGNSVSGESPFDIEICESDNHSSGYGGCVESLGYFEDKTSSVGGGYHGFSVDVTIPGDDGTQERVFTSLATNTLGSTSEFSLNFDTATNQQYFIIEHFITVVSPSGITNSSKPMFDWDSNEDLDLLKYEVYLDGTKIAETPHDITKYQYTGANLAGEHTWQVIGKRINGTISGQSNSQVFDVQLGTVLSPLSPTANQIIDTKTPLLDWDADPENDLNNYDIYLNGQYYATVYGDTNTQYQIIDPLEEGIYTWQVVAYYKGTNSEGVEIVQESGRSTTETFEIKIGTPIVEEPISFPEDDEIQTEDPISFPEDETQAGGTIDNSGGVSPVLLVVGGVSTVGVGSAGYFALKRKPKFNQF